MTAKHTTRSVLFVVGLTLAGSLAARAQTAASGDNDAAASEAVEGSPPAPTKAPAALEPQALPLEPGNAASPAAASASQATTPAANGKEAATIGDASTVAAPHAIRALTQTASTVATERPFRLGYIDIDKALDRTKPLAMLDPAGFVINSGVLIGGFDSKWVGGLNMATRKMAWWFEGLADVTAPPGSFGSAVVLGFRNGIVNKLDAVTGKKLWSANLDSFTERSFLLNGSTLYVLTAAQVLYALDFQSGKTLWLFDGGFPDGLTIRAGARPVVHDNKVLFGIATGEILAVNADTGKLVWRYNPSYNDARFHGVVGEMVIRNNKLLISRYDGLVAAINLDGSVRSVAWQEQFPGLTTSAFRGNRLYVGGLNGDVYGLDPDTGRGIFRSVTGAAVTSIVASETTLFVAGHRGRVSALQTANGDLLWSDSLGGALASPPILYEDGIYYATGIKSLYAYKLR